MGHKLDSSTFQPLAQEIRVVPAASYNTFRLLLRSPLGARDTNFLERGFRKFNFCRRGFIKPNSQRKSLTVDQEYPLRPIAPLGFAECRASFGAAAKPPSKNASSHFSRPSASSAPAEYATHPATNLGTATASTVTSKLRERKIRRARSAKPPSLQNSQDVLETGPIRCPESSPVVLPPSRLGQLRFNQFPLLICR